jgi:hypothetical protein
MSLQPKLERRLRAAIQHFWRTRESQAQRQGARSGTKDTGARSAVTGGAQMGGFVSLVRDLLCENGLERTQVHCKASLELPGWYRPEKKWDLLFVSNGQLIAGIEFKSQVGPSFGNNYNNRTEEALGSATDLWAAYREGAFAPSAKPWLGYLMMLEVQGRLLRQALPSASHEAGPGAPLRFGVSPPVGSGERPEGALRRAGPGAGFRDLHWLSTGESNRDRADEREVACFGVRSDESRCASGSGRCSTGVSFQVRVSRTRPARDLNTPPHCLKKKGTRARAQRSRISRTQAESIGRAPGPDSPPTITQSMPLRSSFLSDPSRGSRLKNLMRAPVFRRWRSAHLG